METKEETLLKRIKDLEALNSIYVKNNNKLRERITELEEQLSAAVTYSE